MKNKQQPLNSTKTGKGAVLSLHQLFLNSLKDIYGAEKTLVKELPEMMEKASYPNLQSAIADHLAITENQVLRLEKIFDLLKEIVLAGAQSHSFFVLFLRSGFKKLFYIFKVSILDKGEIVGH